ncbi:GTP-binding nuclear protein Ran-related protein [Macrophomina phaseolina MS6]|uniref:GTP-binding nuclear protein Ran-related protein n=1 Tax=Macrophomina phaseolina (strain MS6) TaxID=1126212 RepID=K2RUC6_MACPH|nr:GTP-binding nuclear protein Ran-related protein [Macrophomina phaseolina MS6]
MIELISARGNTSLESAVTLTKALRWDIQSLGVRLAKAAGEEELQRRGSSRAKPRVENQLEVKAIISDIKKLLARIEDAVPLINLAITTSGASLSSSLPSSVSPSRLLQASTFLTAGDTQYSMNPARSQQIGPAFTLSMYMLFGGHIRPQDEEGIRETTWKEVIHKARVKLMRVPLDCIWDFPSSSQSTTSHANGNIRALEGKSYEFAYQLLIIEDLDDDRVHTFEEGELQPGPFEDVARAGTREVVPIHEISKIFYADTGKILNIGTDGETNSPILLLKRDVNAVPPRRMMERQTTEQLYEEYDDGPQPAQEEAVAANTTKQDEQTEIDAQLFRESSRGPEPTRQEEAEHDNEVPQPWRLPPNLDPEWIAFEVYTEESDSEDEDEVTEDTHIPPPPLSSSPSGGRSSSLDPNLTTGLSHLNLRTPSPGPGNVSSSPAPGTVLQTRPSHPSPGPTYSSFQPSTGLPPIRTSLSLLEMLVRLTALQQFQQSSHLSIPDELLTFFLSESASTVGAGSDAEMRRRVRRDAIRRVGFDPYDESPIKRRGEEYLEREMHQHGEPFEYGYEGDEERGSRQGSPYTQIQDGDYYDSDSRYYRGPSPHSPSSSASHERAGSTRAGVVGSSSPLRSYSTHLTSPPPPHRDVPVQSRETSAQPSPLLRKATTGVGERRRVG